MFNQILKMEVPYFTCSISSVVSYSAPLSHCKDFLAAFSLSFDRRNRGDSGSMKTDAATITGFYKIVEIRLYLCVKDFLNYQEVLRSI